MSKSKVAAAGALAVSLLIGLEGYPGKPYFDSAGILTDCYGNTHNVRLGVVRSTAECQALLHSEVGRILTKVARNDVKGEMTVGMLAAVASWMYNVGDGAYATSTLRKRQREGRYIEMCQEMRRWNKITVAGVKVRLPGLDNRREKEVAVCLS